MQFCTLLLLLGKQYAGWDVSSTSGAGTTVTEKLTQSLLQELEEKDE